MVHHVALVGCAHIHTPGFIKRLNDRSDIRVKAVWDHDVERAGLRAKELNAPVVSDLSRIWSDAEIEAVIICSETNRHEELVLPAAQAKKNLFAEKPFGMGAADSYRMAQAIDAAGVYFHTGFFRRGDAIHVFAREQIQKGNFGKITRIRHTNCHSGSLGGWFDTDWRWMADYSQAGVGAYGDMGAHSLDILLWLMGDVTSVTASINVVTGRYGDCDESGEGLLQFANGAVGSMAAGWVDVTDPAWLEISGTEGHAHVHDGQLYFVSKHVNGADGKNPWTDLPPKQTSGFDLFLDAIEGKATSPLITAQEAAYRSAVIEALYVGHQEKRWITPRKA